MLFKFITLLNCILLLRYQLYDFCFVYNFFFFILLKKKNEWSLMQKINKIRPYIWNEIEHATIIDKYL